MTNSECPARIVVAPPRPGLDMAAHYGRLQSTAIRAGDLLFVWGVVAIDPETGERLNGTVTSEAEQVLQNLKIEIECVALIGRAAHSVTWSRGCARSCA